MLHTLEPKKKERKDEFSYYSSFTLFIPSQLSETLENHNTPPCLQYCDISYRTPSFLPIHSPIVGIVVISYCEMPCDSHPKHCTFLAIALNTTLKTSVCSGLSPVRTMTMVIPEGDGSHGN